MMIRKRQSAGLAAFQSVQRIQAPGTLYSTEPAPFIASSPSSAVNRTVVWIFEIAPPAAAAISADAVLTLSGPSTIRQRSNSPNE